MALTRTGGPGRRTRLRARSAKQQARLDHAAPIKAAALDRDGRCLLDVLDGHRCYGPLTPHHLAKTAAGTAAEVDTYAGIVALCAAGNTAVEDFPDRYHALGLVRRRGETIAECWARMAYYGLTVHVRPPAVPAHLCPYRRWLPPRTDVPVRLAAPDPF